MRECGIWCNKFKRVNRVGTGGMERIINFVMRCVLGTIAMYFINTILTKAQISPNVGINGLTILTSGFLGIPGLFMLYGIGFYKSL